MIKKGTGERFNHILKSQSQIEHPRRRYFGNFIANMISGPFTYAFYATKPHINIDNL